MPVDPFEKAVHEMLPGLLAVGDDVDAGGLLGLQRDQRGVALAFAQVRRRRAATAPRASRGSASQEGFGRLPAMVVSSTVFSRSGAAAVVLGYRLATVNPCAEARR